MTPKFSVVVLTAPPPGLAQEAGGAYVKVDGREALLRSVELFLNRPGIAQVLLAVAPEDIDTARDRYGPHLSFSGVKLVAGGPRWMDQVSAATAAVAADATHVVLHDAARPVVPAADIDAILSAAASHPAVGLSTAVRTTLVETDEGGSAMAYRLPQNYVHLLTPQAFDRATFDALVKTRVETHPSTVTLIKGSPLNVRVARARRRWPRRCWPCSPNRRCDRAARSKRRSGETSSRRQNSSHRWGTDGHRWRLERPCGHEDLARPPRRPQVADPHVRGLFGSGANGSKVHFEVPESLPASRSAAINDDCEGASAFAAGRGIEACSPSHHPRAFGASGARGRGTSIGLGSVFICARDVVTTSSA